MVVEVMELKDVILSTLAEMEETKEGAKHTGVKEPHKQEVKSFTQTSAAPAQVSANHSVKQEYSSSEGELLFLNSMRERLLVLFEGFQSPNNANIEAKIDLTLNFLEYSLATIDERLEKLKKENKSESV